MHRLNESRARKAHPVHYAEAEPSMQEQACPLQEVTPFRHVIF